MRNLNRDDLMRKLRGIGICDRCKKATTWYDTITERPGEAIIQIGSLTKSVSSYRKSPEGDKFIFKIICDNCSNHYDTNEYEEEKL